MTGQVRSKFFSGIKWTLLQTLLVKALGLLTTIVLARLLLPSDFGLIGMLSIFIAISDVFIQCGFGQALIQKANCLEEDFSTAFYFNLAIALIIYIILFLLAPLISSFYHEPRLVNITRCLSLNFVLGSLNIVQQSKLSKAMDFKPLAIISLVATSISGIVGITLAFCGYGVWSLVLQSLAYTLSRVVIFPFFTKWKPILKFSIQSFCHLWRYGSKILVAGILDVILSNFSNIIIGRFYNKEQVGYFSKGRTFADIPASTMSSVLGTVLFPLLSEIQDDESYHTSVYKKVCVNTILFTFPIMILLFLLARPIILIFFTEKWAACIPLFQALLLARMFLPLNVVNANLLQSKGETKLFMKLYFITGPLTLVAIIFSIPFGVEAMAWATFISNFAYYSIYSIVIGKKIGYSMFKLLWDCRLIGLSLFLMSIGVFLVIHLYTSLWVQLLIGGIVGTVIYSGCCIFFNLIDQEMKLILMSKIKRI